MSTFTANDSMSIHQPSEQEFDQVPRDHRDIIHRKSRSFSVASRLLPRAVRTDVQKLYAWCRWCDDAVDSTPSRDIALARWQQLRDDVDRIYRGERPIHPASHWLAELVARYPIERQLPLDLLEGMHMDLSLGRIADQEALLRYCYHAAGVVGMMMCRLFGLSDPNADRHAKSLGIAMQLTNIARDVCEDALRGRCYLPCTWMEQRQETSLPSDVPKAVERVLVLADAHYAIGESGMHYLPAHVRRSVRIAAAVYREIGQEIRRRECQVLEARTVVPIRSFVFAATTALIRGSIRDIRRALIPNRENSLPAFNNPMEMMMNDAKYIAYLGLSLTAFMATGLFLLVMLNPKDASYSYLPLIYAFVSFGVGVITNLLAKRAETSRATSVTDHVSV